MDTGLKTEMCWCSLRGTCFWHLLFLIPSSPAPFFPPRVHRGYSACPFRDAQVAVCQPGRCETDFAAIRTSPPAPAFPSAHLTPPRTRPPPAAERTGGLPCCVSGERRGAPQLLSVSPGSATTVVSWNEAGMPSDRLPGRPRLPPLFYFTPSVHPPRHTSSINAKQGSSV